MWAGGPGVMQAYLVLVSSLYCASQILSFFFFNKWKVCVNPALSESIGAIFLTAFAHFRSLCHTLTILAIFQTFSLLL